MLSRRPRENGHQQRCFQSAQESADLRDLAFHIGVVKCDVVVYPAGVVRNNDQRMLPGLFGGFAEGLRNIQIVRVVEPLRRLCVHPYDLIRRISRLRERGGGRHQNKNETE